MFEGPLSTVSRKIFAIEYILSRFFGIYKAYAFLHCSKHKIQSFVSYREYGEFSGLNLAESYNSLKFRQNLQLLVDMSTEFCRGCGQSQSMVGCQCILHNGERHFQEKLGYFRICCYICRIHGTLVVGWVALEE